jgi:hypothetical protein
MPFHDKNGAINGVQTCADGDPRCDFDGVSRGHHRSRPRKRLLGDARRPDHREDERGGQQGRVAGPEGGVVALHRGKKTTIG